MADAKPAAGPGKGQKTCFNCGGQGTIICRAPGCIGGRVDCPGPCLKLTRGNWIHMNVAGHPPTDLWMKFPDSNGRGYQAWNQHHAGEVIAYQAGTAVNIGACKICGGSTKVACPVCKGAGKVTCELCKGEKFVPKEWSPLDNPWLNSQADLIRFRDGKVMLGKVITNGTDRLVKTRDGKFAHVAASDILARPYSNSVPASGASTKL